MQQAAPSIKDLFFAALELESPAARSAFLDRHCGDAELRRRIEELLAVDAQGSDFLEVPAAMVTVTTAPDPRPGVEEAGAVIGPYKLLEAIGEGGMGVVYVAEQTEPVRRRVALKVIKPGMDSKQVVARFEAERQALAMMDHPNIAKVHDAGMTPAGRPYLAMELVRGLPITEYCDRHELSIPERLELFALVCRAVQHAHQKGVIHRDIKPSNILVTVIDGVAVPKVIDFGVAKATGGALTDKTVYTGFHQFVGTPLYVSPEQAELSGVDVDTRSDIYSLGVLLYELLTGTTPFDSETLRRAAFDEMRRIIREEEPPRPSTRLSTLGERLSTVSARRKADPRRLGTTLKGELDWMVMKALEKDRRRRYETASDFASDVMRYLTDRPVEAHPPSAWYRFGKFARRNRVALTVTGLLVTVSLAAVAVGTALVWREKEQTRRALLQSRAHARTAEERLVLARRAVDDMYTQFAERLLGEHEQLDAVQREFLEKALAYYQGFSKEQGAAPEVRAETAEASARVGKLQHLLGKYEQAAEGYRDASDQYTALVRELPGRPEYRLGLARATRELAHQLTHLDRLNEAERAAREAMEVLRTVPGNPPATAEHRKAWAATHGTLGLVLQKGGSFSDAEGPYRKARDFYTKLVTESPKEASCRDELAGIEVNLGNVLVNSDRHEQAEEAYGRARELFEGLIKEFPRQPGYRSGLAMALGNLGRTNQRAGKFREAEPLLLRAIEVNGGLANEFPDRPEYRQRLQAVRINLAFILVDLGRPRDAEFQAREALKSTEQLAARFPSVPDYRFHIAAARANLADALDATGRPEEGEEAARRSVEVIESLAADFPERREFRERLPRDYSSLAWRLVKAEKLAGAEREFRRGVEAGEDLVKLDLKMPAYREWVGGCRSDLAVLLAARGERDEAGRLFEGAVEHAMAGLDVEPKHPGCRRVLKNVCLNLCDLVLIDEPERAERLAREVLSINPDDEVALAAVGWGAYRRGDWRACIEALERSGVEKAAEKDRFIADFVLAMALWQTGDKPRARSLFERADKHAREYEGRWKPYLIPSPRTIRLLREEASKLLGVEGPATEPPEG